MSYNIEIASFLHTGLCYQMSDGSVNLYYRIGTTTPWKIFTRHRANGMLSMQILLTSTYY